MMKNKSTLLNKFFSKTSLTASRLLSALVVVVFSSSVLAQSPITIKYSDTPTGTGTFSVPNCVTTITVQAWGAGGGGGYRTTAGSKDGYGNSGGGGGAYEMTTYNNLTPGQSFTYTIGEGGSGGPKVTTNGINKKDGKNTTFGSLIAQGGKGSNNQTVENDEFPYGNGGVATTANGRSGGKGSKAGKINEVDYGGGGGGAGYPFVNAANNGSGGDGSIRIGGRSSIGDLLGGKGGNGGTSTSNSGEKGVEFGGGGGGALKFLTGSPIGGDGAHGGIIITYTTVTPPSITSQPATTGQSLCIGATATSLSVSASAGSGTINKYEWYSNATASNTGGTLVRTNLVSTSPNTYTPSTAATGTLYYYVVVTNSNGCMVTSNVSGPITVTPNNTITLTSAAGTDSQKVCINTPLTNITYTTTGTTDANFTGLPAGVKAIWSNNIITISGTPTVAGISNYKIKLTGGCGEVFATGMITVNAPPTTYNVTGGGNYCSGGSGVVVGLSGSQTGVNYQLQIGGVNIGNVVAGNGSVINFGNRTTAGTYTVVATNATTTCTTTMTGNAVVAVNSTPTLTGVSLSNAVCPGSGAIINLQGLLPDRTFTVTYTINGVVQTPVLNVISNGSGTANFTTSSLTSANDYQSLFIKSVTTTSNIPNCTAAFNNISVQLRLFLDYAPKNIKADSPTCDGFVVRWDPSNSNLSPEYLIDIATSSNFTPGTILPSYNQLNLGNVQNVTLVGLSPEINYYFRVRANGPCGLSSYSSTSLPQKTRGTVAPVLSDISQPTCSNSMGSFTITNYKQAYNYQYVISPNTGVVINEQYVTAPPGNYTITVKENDCTSTKTFFTINPVPAAPATPKIDKVTQPTCTVASGSVFLSNLPATGWTINPGNITGVGSSATISGLASGIYNFSVFNGACSSTATINVVINPTDKIWNGSVWSDGGTLPTADQSITLAGNYSTNTASIEACNCQINSGKTLTIVAGSSATIQNNIINNGNIVVESDGNLIQNNDDGTYTGTGSFKVLRNSNMKRLDYTYWSAPVKDQQLKAFSPSTVATRFLEYHENDDYFYPVNWSTNFEITKGYAIRAPNNFPATYTVGNPLNLLKGTFVGTPNNGLIPFTLSSIGNGYNLVGNPYASNIDFEELLTAKGSDGISNKDKIFGTAYFWTNNDPNPPKEQQGSAYNGNNYAIYNGTGGVPSLETKAAPSGGAVPTQIIKVGQGFIVKSKPTANNQALVFNNSIRSESNDSKFFSKGNTSTKDRYWLKLTSPALNVNTILIGYIPNATNGFELDYDAPLMVVGSDSFYSMLNQYKLGIQGRQYPLNTSDVVALGTNQYEPGNYTISLGNKEGIFADGQNIYLKDKQTGTVTNLSEGSYTFAANKGVSEGRFDIVYQPEIVLATGSNAKEELVIYRDGNDFIVKAQSKKITSVQVFDTAGKLIYVTNPNTTKAVVPSDRMVNGVYVLKINQNEQVTTKKVIK